MVEIFGVKAIVYTVGALGTLMRIRAFVEAWEKRSARDL